MSFLIDTPYLALSGLAVVGYLGWALRLERSRGRASWRGWVLAAIAACLFLLLARPAVETSVEAATAILLTAGSDRVAELDLDDSASPLALPGAPSGLGEPVADLAAVVRARPELRRWLVAGTGLDAWQLAVLPGGVSFASPVEPRPGIDRARWRRRIALGESLEVRGSVRMAEDTLATLTLVGPSGPEGMLEVENGSSYNLSATPRQVGRFLYRLELEGSPGSLGSLAREVVDVEVTPARPPRLLWLEGAPGFESREVKAWLRDLGGALVARAQISRGRFRYDYLNRQRIDLTRLGPAVLAKFDVVAIDGPSWSGLSSAEQTVLERAVEEGLGLVLVPPLPRLGRGGGAPALFGVEAVGDLEELEVTVEGPRGSRLAPLVIEARQFEAQPGQRSLMVDGAGRALVVSRPRGLGQVAATLIEGTYRWPLRGETRTHRFYWSELLSAVARPSSSPTLSLGAGPILVDRPRRIDLVDAPTGPESRMGEAARIVGPAGEEHVLAWAEDPLEPRRHRATLWPRNVGWHSLAWGQESYAFYVADAVDWQAWQEREAHSATALRAAIGERGLGDAGAEVGLRAMARWPFFLALLAGWALLWADEQWRAVPARA